MKSWESPQVQPLPASGIAPRLHDTRTCTIREVHPSEPGHARLYVCGITPYDSTHLGHAATYHAADLMRRACLDTGWEVELAQNVTDVDDPLFERADRDGVDWRDLAREQSELFAGDMEALRILAPQTYRSVSEAVPDIAATVEALVGRGRAYSVPAEEVDGVDWYQDLSVDGTLGSVSGWSREEMMEVFAERGGDPDRAGKRDPLDPLLWRAARPGEPSWDSEVLGAGRPGWHVECVSIAEDALGLPFDVQTGGRDLIFPHHDMSASHAAGLGEGFASIYPHVGMVALDGEKMSKSRGNLVFVSKLVARGVDPMAIRLVLMDHHYRSDWEWTERDLEKAERRLASYRRAAAEVPERPDAAVVEELRAALRDDLDTPRALLALDRWADGESTDGAGPSTREDGTHPADAAPFDTGAPSDVPAAADALFGLSLRG